MIWLQSGQRRLSLMALSDDIIDFVALFGLTCGNFMGGLLVLLLLLVKALLL